jgi:NAD+ diphosphatase
MQKPRDSVYKRYIPSCTNRHEPGCCAYWFVFSANRLLVSTDGGTPGIPFAPSLLEWRIEPVRTQYLGTFEDHPCYSAELPPDAASPAGMQFSDIRGLYGAIDEDLFYLVGRAVQIMAWDQTHQFCGRCGAPMDRMTEEHAKVCPSCGLICYPRISPAVITAILRDGKILLAHAKHFKGNMFSLIAGFVEPGETLEDCVRREIMEEVGLKVSNIRYFGSQQWPFPNSLMIGFVADYESGEIRVDGAEIVEAGWFTADHLPVLPEEISIARKIINWYAEEYSTSRVNARP